MISRITWTILAMLLVATPAWAQMGSRRMRPPIYGDTGVYAQVGGLNGFQTFRNADGVDVENTFGVNLAVGMRFHPRVSGELELDYLVGFDVNEVPEPPGSTTQVALEIPGVLVTGNAKGYLLTGRFQPYAVGGIGFMYADLRSRNAVTIECAIWYCFNNRAVIRDDVVFAARLGAGVDFWITENWALNLESSYVLPTGDLADLRFVNLSWGVSYRF